VSKNKINANHRAGVWRGARAFSTPAYGFTRETLTTMFGNHALTEDTMDVHSVTAIRADMERRLFLLWHSTRTMCIHIRATKEIPA